MDVTPPKSPRSKCLPAASCDDPLTTRTNNRIKKPPPITPRRFTRFFTPRPQHPAHAIRTSRTALRAISGTTLNVRQNRRQRRPSQQPVHENDAPRGRKRKLSFVLADSSAPSSPVSKTAPSHSSQDLIRSSPTIPERRTPIRVSHEHLDTCNTEDETEVEDDFDCEDDEEHESVPRILTYKSKSTSGNVLWSRLGGRRSSKEAHTSHVWQEETANFSTSAKDVNAEFIGEVATLPFSAASCHTNSLVAIGDEEGRIRLFDTAASAEDGMARTWLTMTPHENALMDLEFSPDDKYLATASGDQTCQVIDVQSQRSLCRFGGHRSSVKKVAFQPGSGNNILASCGRDGQVNFWDLRCSNAPCWYVTRRLPTSVSMAVSARTIAPTHTIRDAHTGTRVKSLGAMAKPAARNTRSDFSITSLSFLDETRQHLLVTASEVDSTIKLWDMRRSHSASRSTPKPLSLVEAPKSHAHHRPFGITSIAVSTDASKLYSLSRDHTVYAYSTSHLILGCAGHLSPRNATPPRLGDNHEGLGPLYGFRHPSMRIQTFWNRLAIRKSTDSHSEVLAVGSSNDCAVLFPTNERYLTNATQKVPALHDAATLKSHTLESTNDLPPRPALNRSSSSSLSFSNRLSAALDDDQSLPIYQHGTPLIRGHSKEVTSLTWSFDGHLVTASDDYTVRCWRENAHEARSLRLSGEGNGFRWRKGWSDVGTPGYDDEF